jgi:hypothetical protein
MPYSPVEIRRRFGGIYCLHLQGRRVSQAINMNRATNSLHGVTLQEVIGVLFIATAVRSS